MAGVRGTLSRIVILIVVVVFVFVVIVVFGPTRRPMLSTRTGMMTTITRSITTTITIAICDKGLRLAPLASSPRLYNGAPEAAASPPL